MAGNPNPGGTREPVLTSAGLTAAIMSVVNVLVVLNIVDRKSTRLNSSHSDRSRMPSSA